MSSCEAKRLPKPPLQGYLEKRIARNLAIAFTLGISGAAVVYLTVCVPLEKAYEEYNKYVSPIS